VKKSEENKERGKKASVIAEGEWGDAVNKDDSKKASASF
jgi:hypothetical protein